MADFSVNNSNNRFTLRLTVNEVSTDVVNNTSTVSYTLKLIANTGYNFVDYKIGRTVTLDGTVVYNVSRSSSGYFTLPAYSSITLATGTAVIPHNSDGSKTLSVAFSIDMASREYTPGPLSGTGSMPLTTIPRASALGSIANFNVGDPITITFTKYSSGFTDNLTISYSGTTIKTISNITSGTQVNFTTSELNTIYNLMSTVKSGTFTFTLRTYSGGTLLGTSTKTATGTITNANPELDATVTDANPSTIALTGSPAVLVRYKSTAFIQIIASGKKGASIVSKVVNGINVPGNNLTIYNVDTTSFIVTVTDSRGNSSSTILNPVMVQYVPLTASVNFFRPSPTTGQVSVSFSGNYFNGSFGSQSNTLILSWQYREKGSSTWIVGGTLLSGVHYTISGNKYTSIGNVSLGYIFNYEKTYEFLFVFSDRLTSSNSGAITVARGYPVFDWSSNSFNINVPLQNFTINNSPVLIDFIVAQGTSGIWMYRKWNSGLAELWCAYASGSVACTQQTAGASSYYSDPIAVDPFPFSLVQGSIITFYSSKNGNRWYSSYNDSTATNIIQFRANSTVAVTTSFTTNIYVVGRWQ